MPLTAHYLRLYALVLLAVLLVVLLCVAMVTGLNSVRHQAWLESAPRPLMSWLAQRPQAARLVADLPHSAQLRMLPLQEASLSNTERERLSYGQLLAKSRHDGRLLYFPIGTDGLLELHLQDVYRHLGELTAQVLVWEVERLGLSLASPQELLALGSSLGVLARPLTHAGQLPEGPVLEQLAQQDVAFHQPSRSAPASLYARLADGQLIKISLPPPFSPWSWRLVFLLGLTVALALAGLMYLMLSQLHQRLRGIENAVGRIARGELEARVSAGTHSTSGLLGGAFNRMAEHIQRLVMVQREMIHGVSHELRTPVARIRFGVQMIEDCDDPQLLQKQLVGIDRDIQELDELIDEILTYARLEQGGPIFSVQAVDAVKLVQQVVDEQQRIKPDLTINSQFSGDSLLYPDTEAEPRYLHRAIQNLVGNATRYARQQVQVRCHFDGDTCRVDVHDDGAGVPEPEWEKVFTAFARLDDSRTRSSGGYGLGLSIVRRILYWHGGQAFVGRSEPLGGACFSLVWPSTQPNGRRKP